MLMFIKMLQTFISFGELLYGTTAEDVLINERLFYCKVLYSI